MCQCSKKQSKTFQELKESREKLKTERASKAKQNPKTKK